MNFSKRLKRRRVSGVNELLSAVSWLHWIQRRLPSKLISPMVAGASPYTGSNFTIAGLVVAEDNRSGRRSGAGQCWLISYKFSTLTVRTTGAPSEQWESYTGVMGALGPVPAPAAVAIAGRLCGIFRLSDLPATAFLSLNRPKLAQLSIQAGEGNLCHHNTALNRRNPAGRATDGRPRGPATNGVPPQQPARCHAGLA